MNKKAKWMKAALCCALSAVMAMGTFALPAAAAETPLGSANANNDMGLNPGGPALLADEPQEDPLQVTYLSDIDWVWAYAGINSAATDMYNDAANLPTNPKKPKKDMRFNGNGNPMYLSFDVCANEYNEINIRGKETSVQYQKGLGTSACSEIVYQLDNQYDTFEAVCGFDVYTLSNKNRPSSAQFKVLGSRTTEESGEYEVLYDSGVVYNSDKSASRPYFVPAILQIDVRDYKFLKLWVSDAGETGMGGANANNQSDDVIWADAKLIKGEEEADTTTFLQVLEKARELSAAGEPETVVPAIKEYFENALANAEAVALKEDATSKEIDDAWNRLLDAIQLLSFKKGDKTALTAMVEDAQKIEQGNYSIESYQALQDAIASVLELLEDTNALEAQISAAQQELQTAINQLEEIVEPDSLAKQMLKQSIDAAELAKKSYPKNLISQIQEKFEAALEYALQVYGEKDATDDVIYEADDALVSMMQYLSFTADLEGLDSAIQNAQDIIASGDYAKDAEMAVYEEKLQDAITLRAEGLITDTEIAPVIQALLDAQANLNPATSETLNIEDLKKEIATSEAIDLDKYLDLGDTKADFTAALQSAKAVRDRALSADETLTQNDVNNALKALHSARAALRLIPNKEALERLLSEAGQKDLSLYTKESGEALTKAMKAAKAVYDNPLATEADVSQATDLLSAAIDDLEPITENPNSSDDGKDSSNPGESSNGSSGGNQTGDALPIAALTLCFASLGALVLVKRKEKK